MFLFFLNDKREKKKWPHLTLWAPGLKGIDPFDLILNLPQTG